MDYAVHEILQARILQWIAFPFSRGSSQPRDRIQVSRIAHASKPSFRGVSDGWSGFYSVVSRRREIFLSTCNQRRTCWKLPVTVTPWVWMFHQTTWNPENKDYAVFSPPGNTPGGLNIAYCHWWGWTFYFPVTVWSRARSVEILLCSVWFLTTRRNECGLGVGMKEWVLV